MAKRKLKKSNLNKNHSNIGAKGSKSSNDDFFQISFQHIISGNHCFSKLDNADKAAVANTIFKRKNLTWNEIQRKDKHGLGSEKIPVKSISARKPSFIKDDTEFYLAFRFNGKKPMVGYRINSVFYVLWFDRGFNLYKH